MQLVERGRERFDALLGRWIADRTLSNLVEHPRQLVEAPFEGRVGDGTLSEICKRALELVERVGVASEALDGRTEHVDTVAELREAEREGVHLRTQLDVARRSLAQRLDDGLKVLDLADEIRIARRTLAESLDDRL